MPPTRLSAAGLLDAASICRDRPADEAVLHLVALSVPELSPGACARLSIGARDAALAELHASLFGPRLELAAACPRCKARLDIGLSTEALRVEADAGPRPEVTIDGRRFAVRPANTTDLTAIADLADAARAREVLALRCLEPVEGQSLPEALTEPEIDAVGAALAAVDPASDLYVPLTCLDCASEWEAPIDIPRILASEIGAASERLIDDVHVLASAYHWSEAAILALSPSRRRAYLQRVGG